MTQASNSFSAEQDAPTALPADLRLWIITDGKAGDELQCLGVAEAVAKMSAGATISTRRVAPRKFFAWLAPRGPIDPKDAPSKPGSPLEPPFPDIVIASGRRAIPYVAALRRAAGKGLFGVILKDPRTSPKSADLIWAPAHDRIKGDNVLKTITSPHRVSPARLAAARQNPPPWLAGLPTPRAAVLVGGDSRHHRFTEQDIATFTAHLDALACSGVSLMGSRSRRTPEPLAKAIAEVFARHGGWWWDGSGENPYTDLLAHADAIVVTADSVNMIGEATATGMPVLVFEPKGGHRKIGKFLDSLAEIKAVHHFVGRLEGAPYPPLDSTAEIARAVAAGYLSHTQRQPKRSP
ncbi:MAG: mitochondrial fission ELM1 family protein [Bosea sp. (in: a-proteobacteria)]